MRGIAGLGLRGLSFRPGRSVLCIALVAAATFVIVAVGAFRHEGAADVAARDGAGGGYRLLAWSLSPLHHDLGSIEGQEALGLQPGDLDGVGIARFRARRGDDASCLNLYAPREPTVLAATPSFVRERRFSFQSSLAQTDEERANPWLLLERAREPGGAIPVVADAGTLAYALHRKLGDEMPLGATGIRVRFVAALRTGPPAGPARRWASDTSSRPSRPRRATGSSSSTSPGKRPTRCPPASSRASPTSASTSERPRRACATSTASRTRTSRRSRPWALSASSWAARGSRPSWCATPSSSAASSRSCGRSAIAPRHLARMALVQNGALVGLGFLAGAVPALLAVLPTLLDRRGTVPLSLVAILLLALAATSLLVSWVAVAFVRRLPLIASLRSE